MMSSISSLFGVAFASFVFLSPATGQDDVSGKVEGFAPGHRYGLRSSPDATTGSIRIGSYNVLNYFDEVDDPALSGRWDDADLASRPGQLV